jgi:hypothetical protein
VDTDPLSTPDRVIVPGLIGGLKVVAAGCGIMLILGLIILFAISLTHPFAELGTSREATFAEVVTVTPDRPLAMRIVTATVDPAGVTLDSIPVVINFSTNVPPDEMWVSAIEIDNGRATELEQTSAGNFASAFPADCRSAPCSRTYGLMVCWLKPVAGEESPVYLRAFLKAELRAGTPPANVTVDLGDDKDPVAIRFAQDNGCPTG